MKKVFYSQDLKKYFDTEEECLAAEEEFNKKTLAERKEKEERVAEAKKVEEAYKNYLQLRSDFIKKYNNFHMTLTEKDLPTGSIFDLIDRFFW